MSKLLFTVMFYFIDPILARLIRLSICRITLPSPKEASHAHEFFPMIYGSRWHHVVWNHHWTFLVFYLALVICRYANDDSSIENIFTAINFVLSRYSYFRHRTITRAMVRVCVNVCDCSDDDFFPILGIIWWRLNKTWKWHNICAVKLLFCAIFIYRTRCPF